MTREPDGKFKFVMGGEAKGFVGIALQAAEFAGVKLFVEPLLTDFALDQKGNVSFNFTAGIEPASLLYANALASTPEESSEDSGADAAPPQEGLPADPKSLELLEERL
ncbi:MAG: hypothetical protein G01um101472_558 [Parcubacteria group bacterium Gr01-1014_72]|nr:MAG: hypothetical protein G01um101472_558 [Parcubacteria group bacterium Gr01-1014_72]